MSTIRNSSVVETTLLSPQLQAVRRVAFLQDSCAGVEDDSHGMDEEEEQYDALNDETFGTAMDGDWEHDHEELAKITETSRGWKDDYNDVNHNDHDDLRNGQDHLEASLSQLVLEDNDEVAINRRPTSSHLSHSNLVPYPDSPNALRNSVWAVGKHDGPLSASSPLRPRVNVPQGVKNVCTVEELERNLLQMRSGSGSSLPPPPGLGNPVSGGTLRLEDVERKITQVPPQARMNMVPEMPSRFPPGLGRASILLNTMQNQRLMGPPGHLEAQKVPLQQLPLGFNSSNLPPHLAYRQHTFQPIHPGPGIVPLGPHQAQQHPPPFNMNGPRIPPPFHMNNHMPPHLHQQPQHPPHHQHMPHQQHRNSHPQPYHHHHQQQHHQQQHWVNGAGDYDEYAGLMTPWQKQWLLNIQTLQLNVGVPYVVDYYYTVYKTRQERRRCLTNKSEERSAGRPESVKLRERPESAKPGRDRPPSVMGPAKAYTPLQFENSLGKLQCVSVTAPRKLIDMDIVGSEGQEAPSSQRDLKKTKQLLLEIERLYVLLLELEDAFDPQAIEAVAEAAIARAAKDPPDLEPEPEKPSPEELIQRMTSVLVQGDKLYGFMGIRKGKTFLLRLLPHVPLHTGVHTALWGQVLVGLFGVVRRDQADCLLLRFLPELKRWLEVCDLSLILKVVGEVVAEASLKSKSGKSALATAVNSKFGVSALSAIISSSERHLLEMNQKQKDQWAEFLSAIAVVAETARLSDESSSQSFSLSSETLQRHIDACGSALTNKYGAFLKRLFLSDSLKTESVTATDKSNRRSGDSTLHTIIN
ncbi:protein PAT1 homolog 1 isoform X1 [Frankliniella occidentalis]|uniref:Protein PAT1 homolog 1 isoform X1 n=1 Tax=Frankliniella occidentalis TaxID=133901 RepID=A0A6J1TRC8_FRAOC|nr:protein PAT1 homolog 1 isoform X1 [Frankliniella occidentalis]